MVRGGNLHVVVEPPGLTRFEGRHRFRPELVTNLLDALHVNLRPTSTGQYRRPPVRSKRKVSSLVLPTKTQRPLDGLDDAPVGQADGGVGLREEALERLGVAPAHRGGSGISIIQVVAATMCASFEVTSSLVSLNHAPPSARSTLDLPTPCPPLRMSTLSTLHPGRSARATAEMAQFAPDGARQGVVGNAQNFWSQVSRRFFPSHWRLCRYSFKGSYRWSLATSRSCSATVADFMCMRNLLWRAN